MICTKKTPICRDQLLAENLGECQYVVMHKGETEIVVFHETAAKKAKCVISTCHSAVRGVGMVRGTKQS